MCSLIIVVTSNGVTLKNVLTKPRYFKGNCDMIFQNINKHVTYTWRPVYGFESLEESLLIEEPYMFVIENCIEILSNFLVERNLNMYLNIDINFSMMYEKIHKEKW